MRKITMMMLLLAVLVMGGCASSQLGWKNADGQSSAGKPKYVEDFDPKTLSGDEIVVSDEVEKEKNPSGMAVPDTQLSTQSPQAGAQESVMGFRVQIMIGKNKAAIDEEHKKAMFKFDVPVYVEFQSPNYKIRVGDFLTRHEAEQLRDIAEHRHQYQGAWVVRCKVNPPAQPQ